MALPPLDVNALPLVLAGPIVRRVDAGSTTVWLALKTARKVTLEVWAGESSPGVPIDKKQEGTAVTARIGEYIHVIAVTARGSALAPGTTYRYTLRFGDTASPATPVEATGKGLFDAGIIAAIADDARKALLYTTTAGAPGLPSFITPPGTPGGLRIIHGSCRKPHGQGRDALSILDQILAADIAAPERRPHQLLLTGDQIYADDVADVLLQVCMTRGATLLGRAEVLPGFTEQARRLRPGRRQADMVDVFHMSSEHAKSHLATFAEFACMYLLAWSNVLWPPRLLDGWPDVYPEEAARLGQPTGEMLFGLIVQKSYTHAHETLMEFVAECDRLEQFVAGLPAVRRALANTATYMMFDDHEVTDDWFITERWVRDVIGSALGRRLLTNALSAFAVFQAWGNAPDQFGSGTAGDAGRAILTALATPDPTVATVAAELERRLGIPTGVVSGVPQRPTGAIDWHFSITWSSHQMVVLDTRTRRRYPGGPQAPPALLLGDADYDAMLPAAEVPLAVTIVVSPAPAIGFPLLDQVLQPLLTTNYEGVLANDGEAWGLQAAAYEKFIARLMTMAAPDADGVRRHRLVLLSGDVHYGFTTRLNYTTTAPFHAPVGQAEGVIAQFVSSSLKNQEAGFPKTEFLHNADLVTSSIDRHEDRAGWANTGGQPLKVGEEWVPRGDRLVRTEYWVSGDPAMTRMDPGRTVTRTPEWRYTVDLIAHSEADAAARPGVPMPVAFPLQDRSQAIAQYVAAASNHDNYHGVWGKGKGVVGVNNLGEVQFVWPATGDKSVVQTLWWRIGTEPLAAPLTRTAIPLKIVPVDAPLYGALDLREEDHDGVSDAAPVYAGISRSDLVGQQHVRALQRDLRELGIHMDRADDGKFTRFTRWAVREFQGYAKMAGIAREDLPPTTTLSAAITATATSVSLAAALPTGTLARLKIENEILEITGGAGSMTPTVLRGRQGTMAAAHAAGVTVAFLDRWSARLRPLANLARYDGPVSGIVNARTRAAIARWKQDRLRCPVVIEAWEGTPVARTRMHRTGATTTEPERPAENVWRSDEVATSNLDPYSGPTVFVRDLSDHWDRPAAHAADGPAEGALSVLAANVAYPAKSTRGGVADPLYELYWAEAEILPERLIAGATLATLDAQALSTFKVVRAVSEVEAVGFFDGLNAYDDAFVSLGPCHWTAGQMISSTTTARELWDVRDGELWAFCAYLRAVNPREFARVLGDFGIGPDRAWAADGKRGTPCPWEPEHRKYVARATETDERGTARPMSGRPPTYGQNAAHEYLRTWHWFHRFSMAGRTSAGITHAMWDMARMRIRDILDAEWNNTAVPAATRFTLDAGTRLRDVFRSERTVALIYRWHIFDPKTVFDGTPGAASVALHQILRNAHAAGPAFGTNPAAWTNAHEQSLATAILAYNPAGGWLTSSMNTVNSWPTWTLLPADNGRHFTLDLSVLAAGERQLKLTRTPAADAFQFDTRGLP